MKNITKIILVGIFTVGILSYTDDGFQSFANVLSDDQTLSSVTLEVRGENNWNNIHSNTLTDFNPTVTNPMIQESTFVHPFGIVIGHCILGEMVFVAPTAVCRGDEGTPIHVGDYSNLQDGVVIHALETTENGHNIDDRRFSEDGHRLKGTDPNFADGYAVWVSDNVSLAHGTMLHGPAWIGHNSFIGMETLIFNAKIGSNVAVGVASTITGGVEIPDGKFIPPGSVITTQHQADMLPQRIGSPYENTNDAVLHVNTNLANGYDKFDLEKYVLLREVQMEKSMMETGSSYGLVNESTNIVDSNHNTINSNQNISHSDSSSTDMTYAEYLKSTGGSNTVYDNEPSHSEPSNSDSSHSEPSNSDSSHSEPSNSDSSHE